MKYLIDTHVWLWLLEDPGKLAAPVRQALEAAEDLVLSVASVWEAAIKVKLGKLVLPRGVADARDEFLRQAGARELPIQSAHVIAAADLPPVHRDPVRSTPHRSVAGRATSARYRGQCHPQLRLARRVGDVTPSRVAGAPTQ